MTIESIETRAQELMSMQKIELATRVAEYEDASAVYSNYGQATADPVITDVPAASTEPEVLEPLPTKVEYTGGPLTDAQAVAVFQGEEQPSVETDVGWHMHTPDSALPNATIEGADAAPATDAPTEDAPQ